MSYIAPIADMRFVLVELAGLGAVGELPGLEDATPDLVEAVLEEAAKFASNVLAPLNRAGDVDGARLVDGQVHTTPGWKEAYQAFVEAGWNGLVFDPEWGGQGLPWLVNAAVQEMWHASNMSFGLCPLLTQGAIEAILFHGSDAQRQLYLPKLVSGEWTGTMCLTEPQAGSDLSAVKTRAVRSGDNYIITGQKIFITYGDHDLTPNIVHLVLARTPDAPAGVKGISLFVVPKFLPDASGAPGIDNDVRCVSLEHKLGIHGSPTAVLAFGDGPGAIGSLVGEENRGLEYMFTMMNVARLCMGIEGLAIAERAYQQALAFARDRVQGRVIGAPADQRATIFHHPDVRRMLMSMKARIEAMRAVSYACAAAVDRAHRSPDPAERRSQQALVELLTPIVKGWCTEWAIEIASTGLQVHGGMGYAEETGAAQLYRDARIATIYEGTTGIQAADLVGRKILRDGGVAIRSVIDTIRALDEPLAAQADEPFPALRSTLAAAVGELETAIGWVLQAGGRDLRLALASSVPLLELAGTVLGGYELDRAALRAREMIAAGTGDEVFLTGKIQTAHFYATSILPKAAALARTVVDGAEPIVELADATF